ncbi:MAG: RNA-binding transcriptional accessory protein [Clostridiales bacterium]|nr:RNA-binding transcriptional accessory protein [Clostridiales bacterium]
MNIEKVLQEEFSLPEMQTRQVISLIDSGNTIPFIARYRKEQTGNLDDQVLRRFAEKLDQLRALTERQEDVLRLIEEQGKLTAELSQAIRQASTRAEIDDLYRPFRPKRKTRASAARAQGLQPLADLLASQIASEASIRDLACQLALAPEGPADEAAALAGACDILAEMLSDDAWVRRRLRRLLQNQGQIVAEGRTKETTVYSAYYAYSEPVRSIPGHRVLAIDRGEREKVLSVRVAIDPEEPQALLKGRLVSRPSAAQAWLEQSAADAWKRLLLPSLETEVRNELTAQAQEQAVQVFAANLRSLLLQPPVRGHSVLGLDPGYRTGCKTAVVDPTGRVLATGVVYPTPPRSQTAEAARTLTGLIAKHQVSLIAIGNGTASRETELFVRDMIHDQKLSVRWFVVNEAGASVYSASELGAAEFPDYDVSLRSAISIARRLQDPLAELVKIEPRSIGVGQYQHDLQAKKLDESLRGVVEDCVNQVGVDLNTASAALLAYVSGISPSVAAQIVAFREANGPFRSRHRLLAVPKLGPMTFQQCAGFLRIPDAVQILDNTPVHPERYERVEQLSARFGQPPSPRLAEKLLQQDLSRLAAEFDVGLPTLKDIIEALQKPGRDPRDDMPQPLLRADVLELEDLKPGMVLRGVVRNVADFGAFVDIGVHQDGLVHVSELSDRFVRHPLSVVQVGQAVTVRVLQVDAVRRRISLSMKNVGDSQE